MSDWWKCPNGQCEHGAILHDVNELDDPRPTCCAEGCTCGHDTPPPPSLDVDVVRYGTSIVVNADLLTDRRLVPDLSALIAAQLDEQFRLAAIGPVHGPPIPDDIRAHRRHLARIANIRHNLAYGHPTGHYRRSTR